MDPTYSKRNRLFKPLIVGKSIVQTLVITDAAITKLYSFQLSIYRQDA